ncbi:MAG: helix-turn-helix transcriptional regulator [Clostridia bacterium]|nr:helix-turn-helix transcriptional regulator [Clostridia bacterium]MBO5316276.1 helix-turn-helix transcriptional regulator [Clostridia bacterium]MBR3805739.1 helix-turn-helix transcriptional regulator [Clostridia bacterium]
MIKLKLDKYIDKKQITRYELAKRTGITYHIVDKYYKNAVVRYDSYILDKFCAALDCDVADIIEYIPDDLALR